MDSEVLSLLCSPVSHHSLQLAINMDQNGKTRETLICEATGAEYVLREGIPIFINDADITGSNKKYRGLYDRLAPFYDLTMRMYARIKSGNEMSRRMEYLKELEIKAGDKVLEVSIGTGGNIRFLPVSAEYYGLDLSWGMLQKCRKNLRKWGRSVELFCGLAEELPFQDESFDVVYHMGGINFFNDIAGAAGEMVRVAKPGCKLLIVDETEKVAGKFENVPVSGEFYKDRKEAITSPLYALPPGMEEVRVKDLWDGELYCLTFRKPL